MRSESEIINLFILIDSQSACPNRPSFGMTDAGSRVAYTCDPMKPPSVIRLTPGKRVLFLTKDPELIRKQLRGEIDLQMKDLRVEELLDDINTDAMTPAWVCFDHKPEDLARNAYAGLIVDGKRLF